MFRCAKYVAMTAQVTFQTDYFEVQPGEEEKTNPGVFGQALALWLEKELRARGVSVEGVIPEDFGWVVMIARKPFLLWLGCGNVEGETDEWRIFPVAEPSIFQRLFSRPDINPAVDQLWRYVQELVPIIPNVRRIRWEE